MLRGAVFVALGACGFQSTLRPSDAAIDPPADAALDPDVQLPDAPRDASVDASPDARPPALCDPSDPQLMACYPFEGILEDGSMHRLHPTLTAQTGFAPGKVGDALRVGAGTIVDIPDSAVFDVTALTIEAWVMLSELPRGGEEPVVVDVNGQYNLVIRTNSSVGCTLVGGVSPPDTTMRLTVGPWFHVACTYDGSNSALYVNGVVQSSSTGGGALSAGGTTGLSLAVDNGPGDRSRTHLIGLLDEVRLMNVARTPAQICADAGRTSCP